MTADCGDTHVPPPARTGLGPALTGSMRTVTVHISCIMIRDPLRIHLKLTRLIGLLLLSLHSPLLEGKAARLSIESFQVVI